MLQPEKIKAQKTSKNRIYRRGIIYILLIFLFAFILKMFINLTVVSLNGKSNCVCSPFRLKFLLEL